MRVCVSLSQMYSIMRVECRNNAPTGARGRQRRNQETHIIGSPQEYQRPKATHLGNICISVLAGEGGKPKMGSPKKRVRVYPTRGRAPWYESRTGLQVPRNLLGTSAG